MDSLEILKNTKKLIDNSDNWIKDKFCLKEENNNKYCLLGALNFSATGNVEGYLKDTSVEYIFKALKEFGFNEEIIQFNDDSKTKHADIIKVLNRAIDLLEKI